LGDGSTSVTLVIGLHSDRLRRRFPAFGDYVRRYVDPLRYRIVVTDQGGTPFLEAVGGDKRVTVRLRTCSGELVPLSGTARRLPDTLALLVDFKAQVKHLGVGFRGLRMQLVHVRHDASENSWAVTANREPEWEFPLAMARLIRAPLRRPFAGEGSLFRIGVRGDGSGQTVIVRQIRLFVQESAILRFLNSLSGAAFSEFEDRVDREENTWLREVFAGMRADARPRSRDDGVANGNAARVPGRKNAAISRIAASISRTGARTVVGCHTRRHWNSPSYRTAAGNVSNCWHLTAQSPRQQNSRTKWS
jgi:hypothetical protein